MRALLVPVKSFRQAKLRLASALDDAGREDLARRLAAIVLRAAGPMPAYVACDDGEVADWAVAHGASVLWTPRLGLSGAVSAGVAHLAAHGATLVVVAHADLPLVTSLAEFGTEGTITLAPDHRLDGTNVAAVPAAAGFGFAYGPGSFARHRAEALRIGLRPTVVYDWRLACDVDVPSDLAVLERAGVPLHGTVTGTP